MFDKLRRWFRHAESTAEKAAHGGLVVATPPPGAAAQAGDPDRETSTNAQMEGAIGQPWSGNR